MTGGDRGAGDITPGEGDTIHGGGDIHGEGERQGRGEEGGGVESLDPPKSDRRSPEKNIKINYFTYQNFYIINIL